VIWRWLAGKNGSTKTTFMPGMVTGYVLPMVVAGFVAPYLLDTTTRFVQAAATLPCARHRLVRSATDAADFARLAGFPVDGRVPCCCATSPVKTFYPERPCCVPSGHVAGIPASAVARGRRAGQVGVPAGAAPVTGWRARQWRISGWRER